MALCLIPRSKTTIDMMSFGRIAEYMKKQSPAIIVNQKSVHYKCNDHSYKLIGSSDTSLMALKHNHTMGVYVEKGDEWMTVIQNGRQSHIIPLDQTRLAHSFHVGVLLELKEHQLIQVKPVELWQRTKVKHCFAESTITRSDSTSSVSTPETGFYFKVGLKSI